MTNFLQSLLADFPDREFIQLVLEMLRDDNLTVPSGEIMSRLLKIKNKKDKNLESKMKLLPRLVLEKLGVMIEGVQQTGQFTLEVIQSPSSSSSSIIDSVESDESLCTLIYRLHRKSVPVFTKMKASGEQNLANVYRRWLKETTSTFRCSLI